MNNFKQIIRMATIIVATLLFFFGNVGLEVPARAAEEEMSQKNDPLSSPMRERILEFLQEYQQNRPLTQPEKNVGGKEREKMNFVKQFGTNFTHLDLHGIDFRIEGRQTILTGIDFSYSNLDSCLFDNAAMSSCRFEKTTLNEAMLRCCDLTSASFIDCSLKETAFLYSELNQSRFSGLNATSCIIGSPQFNEADLSHTDFSGAQTWYAGEFHNANMTGCRWRGANLDGAEFMGANLTDADFTNASLYRADFRYAQLKNVSFDGAKLFGANIVNESLSLTSSQQFWLSLRSSKWLYDLGSEIGILFNEFFLILYPGTVLAIVCWSIYRWRLAEHSGLFLALLTFNGCALIPTVCSFVFLFCGGAPVRQLSGNMTAWSNWLYLFPYLTLLLAAAFVGTLVIALVYLGYLICRRVVVLQNRLGTYLVLTIVHVLLAYKWLLVFMPDA